jgi:lysophospholipase L1-like esterase
MRVLIFGASITQGLYDSAGGWVVRLEQHYIKQFLTGGQDVTIFNLGIAGDGSDRLVKRFNNETIARKFPGEEFAFVFSIGTNNTWVKAGGEPVSTPEEYAADIKELINQARQYSQKIMFVGIAPCDESRAHPVPWNKDIFFTNQRLQEFDETLQTVCREEGVKYLPIFDQLKSKLDNGEDIYHDGLHPNDAGHQLIFESVQPALDELLKT